MRGWPVAQGSVMRVSQPWPVGYKEVRNGCEAGGRRSHVCTGHVTAGHMGWKHLLQVSYILPFETEFFLKQVKSNNLRIHFATSIHFLLAPLNMLVSFLTGIIRGWGIHFSRQTLLIRPHYF